MVAEILNGFLNLIVSIVNLVLTPINALVSNIFPDFTNLINVFNNGLNFFAQTGAWIGTLIPPNTKAAIIVYLTFLVTYYTIVISVHTFTKVYILIQRIKFW